MKKNHLLHLVVLLLLPSSIFGQTLVFSHMADGNIGDGTRWSTEIDLVNTTSSQQLVTVSFFNPNGTPKVVIYERGPFGMRKADSSVTFTLIPNGMRVLILDTAAVGENPTYPVNVGWVLVEGSGGIKGNLLFRRIQYARREPDGDVQFDVVVTEAGILPQQASTKVDFIPRVGFLAIDATDPDAPNKAEVGYAVANPNAGLSASGEIQLWDANFGLVARSSFNLPPRGQMSEFVGERFGPNARGQYIRIQTISGSVSAVALRLYSSGLISTIPAN